MAEQEFVNPEEVRGDAPVDVVYEHIPGEVNEVVVMYGPNGEVRYVSIAEVGYWVAMGYTAFPLPEQIYPELIQVETVPGQIETGLEEARRKLEEAIRADAIRRQIEEAQRRIDVERGRLPPEPTVSEPGLPPPANETPWTYEDLNLPSTYIEADTIVYYVDPNGVRYNMTYEEFLEFIRVSTTSPEYPEGRLVFPPPGEITMAEFERIYREWFGAIPPPPPTTEEQIEDWFNAIAGAFRAPRPVYKAPDKALVRQAVEATLVALTGRKNEARVERLIQAYLDADRRNFNNRNQQIDPMSEVEKIIKEYPDYKQIHALRPDTADPLTWISNSEGALLRAGVSPQLAGDIARVQASLAANPQDTARAGEIYTFQQTGRVLPGFFRDLQAQIGAALELL